MFLSRFHIWIRRLYCRSLIEECEPPYTISQEESKELTLRGTRNESP
jgi:hypothetical protein